jgi:aspartate aminotransferase-like enzyme
VAGQDRLKDKVLRVGHMGAMTHEELKNTAQAIEKYL